LPSFGGSRRASSSSADIHPGRDLVDVLDVADHLLQHLADVL
jgi:hypothetical protein